MTSTFPIPLNAIRAIEIVARKGALAPAAEELGVTPGAVSQHLRRAEERLGRSLFERTAQGLRPTEDLTRILPQLTQGFSTLAGALDTLRAADEHVLTVTMGSVFASRWLIWRIAKFTALHPRIEIRLVVTGNMIDLTHSDIDCGIRFGAGVWPGVIAERVVDGRYSPVAAPPVAARLAAPADLAQVPVINDTQSMLPWRPWLADAGLDPELPLNGPTYDDPTLAFDAAISEQGVLMTVDLMSADAVSDGRLVRPFASPVETDLGYWFIVAENKREPTKTRLFREWLRREVADSSDGYVGQFGRMRKAASDA